MIMRRNGRELSFFEDDGETLKFRCWLPEGMTFDDLERFREHLLAEARKSDAGPS